MMQMMDKKNFNDTRPIQESSPRSPTVLNESFDDCFLPIELEPTAIRIFAPVDYQFFEIASINTINYPKVVLFSISRR